MLSGWSSLQRRLTEISKHEASREGTGCLGVRRGEGGNPLKTKQFPTEVSFMAVVIRDVVNSF